jgi:hypothetical protein
MINKSEQFQSEFQEYNIVVYPGMAVTNMSYPLLIVQPSPTTGERLGGGGSRCANHFLIALLGAPHPSAAFVFVDEPRRIVLPTGANRPTTTGVGLETVFDKNLDS